MTESQEERRRRLNLEAVKRYRSAHPERVKASRKLRKRYPVDPAKSREYQARYRETHPDAVKDSQARYRASDKGRRRNQRAEAKRKGTRDQSEYNARPEVRERRRAWDARPEVVARRKAYMKTERAKAIMRRINHERRTAERHGDLTADQDLALRSGRTYCPLCRKRMTDAPRHPHAKHLDHIIPINQGGRHTLMNVRIICATCNKTRPHDGSDYAGQLSLEAVA